MPASLTSSVSYIKKDYTSAHLRALLLDLDGTLTPIVSKPHKVKLTDSLYLLLSSLAAPNKNDVYIISGRTQKELDHWFGILPIGLVAEHGAATKHPRGDWDMESFGYDHVLQLVYSCMENAKSKLPGSIVEIKKFSVAFHYRLAPVDKIRSIIPELMKELSRVTINTQLTLLKGKKVIEIKKSDISKRIAAERILNRKPYTFHLIAGDDKTDEDMFGIKREGGITIKIGYGETKAQVRIKSVPAFLSFLSSLV